MAITIRNRSKRPYRPCLIARRANIAPVAKSVAMMAVRLPRRNRKMTNNNNDALNSKRSPRGTLAVSIW